MFKDEVDDAFDKNAPVPRNNSVRDYQYFSYTHPTPNMPSRIELRFDDTSKYFLPCEAFIEVEGQLTQRDGNAYANLTTTAIGFVNNGIMSLFKSAQYIIGTTKIESIDNDVDVASTIIGLARYSDDFIKSAGHSMMFAKDQTDRANFLPFFMQRPKKATAPADDADVETVVIGINENYKPGFDTLKKMLSANGKFSCVIPLSHIFGFCKDIRKVLFGASHTNVLQRGLDDSHALWRRTDTVAGPNVPNGKITLSKLSLWMPYMTPSLTVETRLLSFMDQGGDLWWHGKRLQQPLQHMRLTVYLLGSSR